MTDTPKRAIVAEDNQILREIISRALGRDGSWTVVKVENGAMTLDAIAEGGADLVIIDWKMDVMDGIECTRRIRAGERHINPRTPVLLVTAAADTEIRDTAHGAGVDQVLRKPFSLAQLQKAITEILPR